MTSLNGPIDKVNSVLSSMTYICRSIDPCASMSLDSISVTVNDEGFTGLGGGLVATASVSILIQ